MTTTNKLYEQREASLKQLQKYLSNWAIIEPELTLILGNVRRMLGEAQQVAIEAAIEVIPKESKSKVVNDRDTVIEETLKNLSALKESN